MVSLRRAIGWVIRGLHPAAPPNDEASLQRVIQWQLFISPSDLPQWAKERKERLVMLLVSTPRIGRKRAMQGAYEWLSCN